MYKTALIGPDQKDRTGTGKQNTIKGRKLRLLENEKAKGIQPSEHDNFSQFKSLLLHFSPSKYDIRK